MLSDLAQAFRCYANGRNAGKPTVSGPEAEDDANTQADEGDQAAEQADDEGVEEAKKNEANYDGFMKFLQKQPSDSAKPITVYAYLQNQTNDTLISQLDKLVRLTRRSWKHGEYKGDCMDMFSNIITYLVARQIDAGPKVRQQEEKKVRSMLLKKARVRHLFVKRFWYTKENGYSGEEVTEMERVEREQLVSNPEGFSNSV